MQWPRPHRVSPTHHQGFYTPIAVELWSQHLIIVRTLVIDVLSLSKMLTQSCRLHFDSGRLLCTNCLFSRNTALHLLTIFTLVIAIVSDFNGIAAGSDCLHDYCNSPDTFQGRRTPVFTIMSMSWKRITTIWEQKKSNNLGNWHTVCHTYTGKFFMIRITAFNIQHTSFWWGGLLSYRIRLWGTFVRGALVRADYVRGAYVHFPSWRAGCSRLEYIDIRSVY